jgi:hypothetical protein
MEPAAAMPIAQWTDEMIIVQGLRVLYHMDAGLAGHLPFATGSAYQWFASKVGGLNTLDSATANSCCSVIEGVRHITLQSGDEFNRNADRSWESLSANIALYLHEARHADGFGHVSCCGIQNGCDQTYDEANLSPYGMQYWVYRAWVEGTINVGVGCLGRSETRRIAQYQVGSANAYPDRFCDRRPPPVILPATPGGECRQ